MHLALSRIVSQHETLAAQPPENSTLSVWLQGFIAESRIGVLTSAKLVSWPASFPAAVHNYRPDNHANGVSRTPKPPVCFPALPLWPGGGKTLLFTKRVYVASRNFSESRDGQANVEKHRRFNPYPCDEYVLITPYTEPGTHDQDGLNPENKARCQVIAEHWAS